MKKMNLEETQVELLPVIQAAQLEKKPIEERWLVDGFWPSHGVGLVGGHPKSCKSLFSLDLCMSVATETPFLGIGEVKTPGTALIYMAEDALNIVRERLQSLADYRGIPLEQIDIQVITASSLRIDSALDMERLDRTVAYFKPRILLLDPLVRLHRIDENNAQEIAALLAGLRELQRRHDTAIALVHHARKNGHNHHQTGQSLRGSSDIFAWADVLHYLNRETKGLRLITEHRAAPQKEPIFLKLEENPLHLAAKDNLSLAEPCIEDRILSTLSRANEPVTRTELRSLLSINNKKLGDSLQSLEKQGKLRKASNGWHV
jgi:RecA-family ATPase